MAAAGGATARRPRSVRGAVRPRRGARGRAAVGVRVAGVGAAPARGAVPRAGARARRRATGEASRGEACVQHCGEAGLKRPAGMSGKARRCVQQGLPRTACM